MNFYYPRLEKIKDFNHLNDTIFKVFLDFNNGNLENVLKELKDKIGHIMTPVDCGHNGIDLIIPGMNKAHGIEFLKDYWQLNGEIMSFGDSGNDQEMLKISKYSYAMGNAKDEIKKVAKYVTDSNNKDGVLNAIDKMFRIK